MNGQVFFPWDDVPDSTIVPEMTALLKGEELTVEETSAETKNKLMLRIRATIEEPKEYAGSQLFERFVIGSDDDPKAERPETWKKSFAAIRFKQMLNAAQVPKLTDLSQIAAAFKNARFVANVTQETQKDGPYAGSTSNRMANFFKIGEREVKLKGKAILPTQGGSVAPPQAPQAQTSVTPQVPQAPAGVAPQPPASVAPQPGGVASQPSAAQPASVTQAQAGPMIPCNICGEQVAVSEFATHVQEKHS